MGLVCWSQDTEKGKNTQDTLSATSKVTAVSGRAGSRAWARANSINSRSMHIFHSSCLSAALLRGRLFLDSAHEPTMAGKSEPAHQDHLPFGFGTLLLPVLYQNGHNLFWRVLLIQGPEVCALQGLAVAPDHQPGAKTPGGGDESQEEEDDDPRCPHCPLPRTAALTWENRNMHWTFGHIKSSTLIPLGLPGNMASFFKDTQYSGYRYDNGSHLLWKNVFKTQWQSINNCRIWAMSSLSLIRLVFLRVWTLS